MAWSHDLNQRQKQSGHVLTEVVDDRHSSRRGRNICICQIKLCQAPSSSHHLTISYTRHIRIQEQWCQNTRPRFFQAHNLKKNKIPERISFFFKYIHVKTEIPEGILFLTAMRSIASNRKQLRALVVNGWQPLRSVLHPHIRVLRYRIPCNAKNDAGVKPGKACYLWNSVSATVYNSGLPSFRITHITA